MLLHHWWFWSCLVCAVPYRCAVTLVPCVPDVLAHQAPVSSMLLWLGEAAPTRAFDLLGQVRPSTSPAVGGTVTYGL